MAGLGAAGGTLVAITIVTLTIAAQRAAPQAGALTTAVGLVVTATIVTAASIWAANLWNDDPGGGLGRLARAVRDRIRDGAVHWAQQGAGRRTSRG